MRFTLPLIFLALVLCACGPDPAAALIGEWTAVSVTQAGDSLALDPAEVGFRFDANGRYHFRSTLKHEEAGTWTYDQGRLIADDTTRTGVPQRVVAVDKMNADSLVLRMLAGEAEQVVVLRRVGG